MKLQFLVPSFLLINSFPPIISALVNPMIMKVKINAMSKISRFHLILI